MDTGRYLSSRAGHDFEEPNFDGLAIFYIAAAIIYTIIVLAGLTALFILRNTHAIRIRNFTVVCASVLSLHVYLVLILLVYPLNGLFKCGCEFWIMSILLPLGIALFQASNVRLYSYAKDQKSIAEGEFRRSRKFHFKFGLSGLYEWFKHLSAETKTYVAIAVGLVVQGTLTIFLFFGSRKFHATYGIYSSHVSASQCRRGTEWIPSVFWQFLWATVFGPYILLRIRNIKDTHYWAWQTRLAIVSCLPGTPLWLIFTYAQGPFFQRVNNRFPPSGWFLPGLVAMQFVSVFFPLLDIYKLKSLERKFGRNRDSTHKGAAEGEKPQNPYSMATLELQLAKNPHHLLYWAYTKEFTAENILFLTAVRDFKRRWEQVAKHTENLSTVQLRERYEEAAVIYFKLVNPVTAKMNINVDSRTYNELEQMFRDVEYQPDDSTSSSGSSSCYTESNVVTPWADLERPASTSSHQSDENKLMNDHVDKLYPLPVTEIHDRSDISEGSIHETKEPIVPASFTLEVFDRAYEVVKNDVYLNTWVRYEARYSRPRSPRTAQRGHRSSTFAA
ncbi:hypothetical protein EJ08DRAFT_54912 [Tothia fuscella]|uniref:RGS domain-containing protein n=1 Tax=Tothia fuscella TaxID=1048955 RepID=A0A9P4NXK5_9PEZI|nr:hypothetical protein EJ08DRAFT_54912 [Tothia fuscella]